MSFHIVLIEPEIPPNTGNIARLCGATGTTLHLVGKLGFSIDDKHLKRAGLDYWEAVDVRRWESLQELQENFPDGRFWYTSKFRRATTKQSRTVNSHSDSQSRRPEFKPFHVCRNHSL
jgi:tRNA (cytidine(34)-2'-O)-methyltransferase